MSIQLDQFTNTVSVNDTVNANSSLNLVGQGTGAVTLKGIGANLITFSQTYQNAVWSVGGGSGITILDNQIVAPNGGSGCPPSTNAIAFATATPAFNLTDNPLQTKSVYHLSL